MSVNDLSSPVPEYSRRATATVPAAPAPKPATNAGAHPNLLLNGLPNSLYSLYSRHSGLSRHSRLDLRRRYETRPLISPMSRDSFSA